MSVVRILCGLGLACDPCVQPAGFCQTAILNSDVPTDGEDSGWESQTR